MPLANAERGYLRETMNRYQRRAMRSRWRTVAGEWREKISSILVSDEQAEDAFAQFEKYHDDPVGFFREVLGIEPWSRQADIIRSVAENAQTAAKTGHRIGKSLLAAGLALWWVCTRREGRVIITAPSGDQVKRIIWRELRKLHDKKLKALIGGELPLDPRVGLRLAGGREIIGISTDTPERLAGLAGPEMLFIIDEASGFPDALYQAIEGNSAGGEDLEDDADDYEQEEASDEPTKAEAKILAIGNPTQPSGWFFEIFRTANPDWERFTISSEESPNITRVANDNGKFPPKIRGLATRSWLARMQRKYGPNPETHPIYMVRVKGLYPERASNSVISLVDVERAQERGRKAWKPKVDGEITLGVDVARFGDDDSVVATEIDDHVLPLDVFPGLDGPDLAAHVELIARARRRGNSRVRVNIDGIGVGASCLDALVRCEAVREGWMYLVNIQVSEVADDEQNYPNLRSQLWFGLGTWLAEGGALPDDSELTREMLAPTYSIVAKSRIQVASKDELKKILGHSPDRAEAVFMAVYRGRREEYRYTGLTSQGTTATHDSFSTRVGWRGRGGAL